MAVILFVAIFQGVSVGKNTAQAVAIVEMVKNISTGLDYFYNDQGRYPNLSEFADQNVMLNYFSSFPFQNFISNSCPESLIYKKNTASSVTLNFCLPVATGGYVKSWNTLSLNK